MPKTVHSGLSGTELHYSKIDLIITTPPAAPAYVGQSQYDTTSGLFYIGVGTATAADWHPVVGTGGLNSVVDSNLTTYTITDSQNAIVLRLTNAAARAVTLPTAPINGFTVTIQDANGTTGSANTGNITLTAGGSDTFQNGTDTFVIYSNLSSFTVVYDVGLSQWVVKSSFVGRNLYVDTLTNPTGSSLLTTAGNILAVTDPTTPTKKLAFALSGATASTTTTLTASQTANRVLTLPDLTDTLVSKTSTDILTNKSFNNTTTILAANALRFYNSGNTFYTGLQAGANAVNINMTLPTTAPSAGQVLYSTDGLATLGWTNTANPTQQTVALATDIDALSSSTTSVIFTGSTACNLNGIVAGVGGQLISLYNGGSQNITVVNQSGSASAADRIRIPVTGIVTSMFLLPGYSLTFIYNAVSSFWDLYPPISSVTLKGDISGNLVYNGFVGETESLTGSTTGPGSNNWRDVAVLILTAGNWLITGQLEGNGITDMSLHIGLTTSSTNTNPADASTGDNLLSITSATSQELCLTLAPRQFISSGTQTVYLNINTGSLTPTCYYRITAVRIS